MRVFDDVVPQGYYCGDPASKYFGTIREMKRGRGLAGGHSVADIGLEMSMGFDS